MGLWSFWGQFDVTLGWLWVYEGSLWSILSIKVVKRRYVMVTLGSCWHHFRHLDVPLGYFGPLLGQFGTTLRLLWGDLGVTFAVWKSLRDTLGAFWGHSKLTLGSLLAYELDFWIVNVPFEVYESQFLKIAVFPMDSNDFTHFPNEF